MTAAKATGDASPNAAMATRGATLWDYARWLLDNAGTSGRLDAAKLIEKAIGK